MKLKPFCSFYEQLMIRMRDLIDLLRNINGFLSLENKLTSEQTCKVHMCAV